MKFINYYRKRLGKQTPSMLRREFDRVAHSFRPQKVAGFVVLFKRYQMGSERFGEDSLLKR